MMMDSQIKMNTIFGDGSNQEKGVLGKIFSAGKRMLTGESLFMTAFLNVGEGKRQVSFASPYPGKILPVDLSEKQGKFICQKDAFLCAAQGVSVGIEFSKKLGRACLAVRVLLCRNWKGTVWLLSMLGVPWRKKNWLPARFLEWTRLYRRLFPDRGLRY